MSTTSNMAIIEKEMGENYILISSKQLAVALINSIRRVLISHIAILGIEEFIQPADYPCINAVFQQSIAKKRYTIIDNNTPFSIPMLAHRLSRLPIFTSSELLRALYIGKEGFKFFLVLSDPADIAKPLVNKSNQEIQVTARSLRAVLAQQSPDGSWTYNKEASMIPIHALFPLDTFILTLYPGQRLHAILRPVLGMGIDNPRWSPCVQRYRFNRDPVWQATHPIKEIIHKKTGELSLRRQFSTKPPSTTAPGEATTYDVFMKPYEVELMVIQNGKMDKVEALLSAVDYLGESLARFNQMLQTGDTFVHKETGGLNIVRYTVPQDTYSDAAQDPINRIYTGHTLANVIVSKMLTIVARDIIPDDISSLAKVLIAYKVPHPLIKQVVYTVQLPEEDPVFQAFFSSFSGPDMAEKLVHLAIQELLVELSSVKAVLLD